MTLDLPIGMAGVTLADIGLRLYGGDNGFLRLAAGGVSLDPTTTGVDYELSGLPEDFGVSYSATYEYPPGVGVSRSWSSSGPESTPPCVIVPLRETGQSGALDLKLFRNGAESTLPLSVQELTSGSDVGDYAVTGWSQALPGERWMLRWQIAGLYFARYWHLDAQAGVDTRHALRMAVEGRIMAAYAQALGVMPSLELQLGGANRVTWPVQAEHQYFRGYYRRAGSQRLSASDWSLSRASGFVVLQLLMTPQTGEGQATDQGVDGISKAIRRSFLTGPDGLQFEEDPRDHDGFLSGSHWLVVIEYPFYADAVRDV